jgi:hypothetical protein
VFRFETRAYKPSRAFDCGKSIAPAIDACTILRSRIRIILREHSY